MAGMKWITIVPLSIKSAQNKILEIAESEWQASGLAGYKIAEKTSEYSNIKQRWLIVESEARKNASIKQINKQVKKQEENVKTALCKLSRQEFACQADAEIAINQLSDSWKYWLFRTWCAGVNLNLSSRLC